MLLLSLRSRGRLRRRIAISSGRLGLITLVGIHGAPSVARMDRQVYINILYIYISPFGWHSLPLLRNIVRQICKTLARPELVRRVVEYAFHAGDY